MPTIATAVAIETDTAIARPWATTPPRRISPKVAIDPQTSLGPVFKAKLRIQVKRGLDANLPAALAQGEPAWTTDSQRFFMGTGSGKREVAVLTPDTDATLSANSDTKVATQKAVKAYVDAIGVPVPWSMTTVEVNLSATPTSSGNFQITGLSGLVTGKPVLIQQAAGPYTGKGTLADEAEMDSIIVKGYVLNATTIQAYWDADRNLVGGNFKFNYRVSG